MFLVYLVIGALQINVLWWWWWWWPTWHREQITQTNCDTVVTSSQSITRRSWRNLVGHTQSHFINKFTYGLAYHTTFPDCSKASCWQTSHRPAYHNMLGPSVMHIASPHIIMNGQTMLTVFESRLWVKSIPTTPPLTISVPFSSAIKHLILMIVGVYKYHKQNSCSTATVQLWSRRDISQMTQSVKTCKR